VPTDNHDFEVERASLQQLVANLRESQVDRSFERQAKDEEIDLLRRDIQGMQERIAALEDEMQGLGHGSAI
jgi:uncharacterized small protein (DUF1192 family)